MDRNLKKILYKQLKKLAEYQNQDILPEEMADITDSIVNIHKELVIRDVLLTICSLCIANFLLSFFVHIKNIGR